jgi:CheY-like chemotaxis protein
MSGSLSILIVDDNPPVVKTLGDVLAVKGYTIYPALSGEEALAVLREHPVDILLTDVRMPAMNGVELFRETRKTHPRLTTILMTAYAADDIIQQGLDEGIKTVLMKPLDINFLLSLFAAIKRHKS